MENLSIYPNILHYLSVISLKKIIVIFNLFLFFNISPCKINFIKIDNYVDDIKMILIWSAKNISLSQ